MCQMHSNSDVQLWNLFLTINSDSTHQKWMKFAFIVTCSNFLQLYWVSDIVTDGEDDGSPQQNFSSHDHQEVNLFTFYQVKNLRCRSSAWIDGCPLSSNVWIFVGKLFKSVDFDYLLIIMNSLLELIAFK